MFPFSRDLVLHCNDDLEEMMISCDLSLTAMHDIIASLVQRCRRLIIILSAETKSWQADSKVEETLLLHNNQNKLSYEQKVGLHDALTQNEPQVILVEIGEDRLRLMRMYFNK